MMDRATIELHETAIRLAKGIVSARERWQHQRPSTELVVVVPVLPTPLSGLLNAPTKELKASIGVWENWLKLETAKPV